MNKTDVLCSPRWKRVRFQSRFPPSGCSACLLPFPAASLWQVFRALSRSGSGESETLLPGANSVTEGMGAGFEDSGRNTVVPVTHLVKAVVFCESYTQKKRKRQLWCTVFSILDIQTLTNARLDSPGWKWEKHNRSVIDLLRS